MSGFKAVYCKEMKRVFKEPKMIFSIFLLFVCLALINADTILGFLYSSKLDNVSSKVPSESSVFEHFISALKLFV